MTVDQIIALKDEGFTAEEINALAPSITEATADHSEHIELMNNTIKNLSEQITKMQNDMQRQMIITTDNQVTKTSARDVAASIINPTYKNKE